GFADNDGPNLVMTREALREGDSLRTHADRQLLDLVRQLPKFELMESGETTVAGRPAIFARFAWAGRLGAIEQSMTHIEQESLAGTIVVTFTSIASAENARKLTPLFRSVLDSVRFDAAAKAPAPIAKSAPTAPPAGTIPLVPMPGRRAASRS